MHETTDDDDWLDSEELDEWDADDTSETSQCPQCGREIYEDAEQCPYCHEYVTTSGGSTSRRPVWIIVTAMVCIYAILHMYLSALFVR